WKSKRPYSTTDSDEKLNSIYKASCYCGAIEYSVSCEPLDSKICHCHTCQKLHGAPMQWASIFPKDKVLFTKGMDDLIFYNSELKLDVHQLPCKLLCRQCHSPIADEGRNMFLAFPSLFHFHNNIIPDKFKPTCHIFYKSRSLDMNDDLPKF
ncbi:Mss4-like protein, partial [Absidia repens]